MKRMVILLISVLTFFLLSAIATIISICKPTETEDTTIYLTEEQMANRPVIEQQKVEEVIEEEEVEEFVDDGTFLYDIVPLDGELQLLTQRLCMEHEVSYAFFLAMLESESGFNGDAKGDSGRSVGYMQINKPNWDKYGLNAFVPQENLEIGIRMMGDLIKKYQDFDMVVMCYKAGEGKAQELKEQGIKLSACDSIAESTLWWEEELSKLRGD